MELWREEEGEKEEREREREREREILNNLFGTVFSLSFFLLDLSF